MEAIYLFLMMMVASQCPHSGGKAVIRARGMINTVCDSIFWNDGPTCALEGYYRKLKKQNNEQCVFLLSPNPAKDKAVLNYKILENNVVVVVYNNIGQLLIEQNIDKNSNEVVLNLSKLNSGAYFFKVKSLDNQIGQGKFIIIN